MNWWLHRKPGAPRVAAVVLAIATLGSTACVKQNQPGVGVVKFDSSAVFGVASNKPAVPGFELPQDVADDIVSDSSAPISPVNPTPDAGPCPAAKLNAFPKATATPQIKGMPAEGLYSWKRDSFILKNANNAASPITQLPFALESRGIRNVARATDHEFNFEMVEPDPFNPRGTLITSFLVNNNPALLVNQRVQSRTIGVVPVPGQDVRIADPNDSPGIFITRIQTEDDKGVRVSDFNPVLPMLIAPLEEGILRAGQTFRSVGIDATNGAVITNDGVVGRPTRVDACGEIVEGYAVTLHQILTSDIQNGAFSNVVTTQETRSVDYIFASQYGALPIGENLSLGDVLQDQLAVAARWELGALTPKPLPASYR